MPQPKRRKYNDEEMNAPSTKRTRYEYDRDFYSLPEYSKPIYHHRYDLRSIEQRKPVGYYSQSSQVKTTQMCTRSSNQSTIPLVTRNAHSYSISTLVPRCSNSSTTSGQKGKQATRKKAVEPPPSTSLVNLRPRRKRKITQDEEDVS